MTTLERFKKLPLSFYLQCSALLLAVISFFYLANVGAPMSKVPEEYTPALICLVLGALVLLTSLILSLFRLPYHEYLRLLAAVLIAIALAYFSTGSVLSIIDKVYNIVMWGDATQFPAIIGFGSTLAASLVLTIATCWLN